MAETAVQTQKMGFIKNVVYIILVGIAAYFYFDKPKYDDKRRLENVLDGLLREERSVNLSTNLPVAVGFGSCIDILVDGIPLMNALGLSPPAEPKYHENIETAEHVAEMFAFYLSKGAAAERFIPMSLLKYMVSVAENLNGSRWAAGGNAPVISSRFAKEGFKNVVVGAPKSKRFDELYPNNLEFTGPLADDVADDIHLILEYKVDDKWGEYIVKRANRFIVNSDYSNSHLSSLESFSDHIDDKKPKLIIVSSLQMLDNFPYKEGVREERMIALKEMLQRVPQESYIHFEMASFGEVEMMRSLMDNVIPFADSLGMNEQELPNILNMIKFGKVIQVAESNPRTAITLDQIRELYTFYKKNSKRGLTRIHLHTLSYQIMLIQKGSAWKSTKAGAAKASLVAHRHVCGADKIDVDKARLIMDDSFLSSLKGDSPRVYFDENSPISCWEEQDYEICIAPVLVCTDVKQTVGGGDNITPAGLIPQL